MLLIQCTKKLANELKMKSMSTELPESALLYSWHAHLFVYNRRKYAMVLNNKTRYTVVFGPLRKKELERFDDHVLEGISETLMRDGFDEKVIKDYLKEASQISYGPTSERSLISQVNDQIKLATHMMKAKEEDGEAMTLPELNRYMNRVPMLQLPDVYSVEAMQKELGVE